MPRPICATAAAWCSRSRLAKARDGFARSWLWRYRFRGREREIGLGPLDRVSLTEARYLVEKYRADWLDKGLDPKDERDKLKAEERMRDEETAAKEAGNAVTFKAAAEAYAKVPAHAKQWTNDHYRHQWLRQLELYIFPRIGSVAVADLNKTMLLECFEPIWGPKTIWDLRGRIEKILDWCEAKGWRPEGKNPASWSALKSLGKARTGEHSVKHHPALDYEQIKPFMAALRDDDCSAARAVEFLILTATRTGDVRFLRWREIKLDKQLWTIPKERLKTGHHDDRENHDVPLSEPAMAILLAIKGDRPPDPDAYVFLGRHGRVLHERAMLTRTHNINPNISDHGFRSTFCDWCGDETKHERETAELALSHKIAGVRGIYRRKTALAKRRLLMDEWARYCESGEVISINTAA
jgi:integrase